MMKTFILIAALLVSACATTGSSQLPGRPPEGKSRIVIYWPAGSPGRLSCPTQKVDDLEAMKLPFGGYSFVDVPPGKHLIYSIKSWCFDLSSEVQVETMANQIVYVRHSFLSTKFPGAQWSQNGLHGFWIGLLPVAEAVAKKELQQ